MTNGIRRMDSLAQELVPPRRPPNLTEKVAVLTDQAFCGCLACRTATARLMRDQRFPKRLIAGAVEYHHADERAAGGADHPDNYLAVTKECHDVETNGAGGSKAKVAKARRLDRARTALAYAEASPNQRVMYEEAGKITPAMLRLLKKQKPRRWPTHKWPKRSFPKRSKRDG